jgi:protein TonB
VAIIAVENVRFKKGYNRYLRNSLFLALVIHFLMFYFSPPFEFKPYVLREEYFEAIDLPEQFDIPPPPKEVAQPAIPMEAAEGEEVDEEADIAPTSFDDVESLPPPPPPPSEQAQEFYAFDEPPVLIKFVSPRYPDLARQAGIEGTVLLEVLVSNEGNRFPRAWRFRSDSSSIKGFWDNAPFARLRNRAFFSPGSHRDGCCEVRSTATSKYVMFIRGRV